jgi:lipid-binding SYLF domain-containing protein
MRASIRTLAIALVGTSALLASGCESGPQKTDEQKKEEKRSELATNVQNAITDFKNKKDGPGAKAFDTAYGYAVFPKVVKAGLVLAGLGATIGGQSFVEIIFFETKGALDRFTQDQFAFSAGASAVAGGSGGGTAIKYTNGVAVYVLDPNGLMLDAAIGGQNFAFKRTPAKK